ncbi:MAG: prepilin-type N-terminal cleavage/methylation domain-containing protein [Negativicutes bacterium]|nr:prepilin-type N-terminal cleavage/methylation domain-containing protein [Negativicutes bacterium]
MMKKMKSKKGFTLVEIVVVLVILAILAAIAIPAYTGYIDKANERAIASEARSVLMAAQTLGSEKYATNKLATLPTADDIKALAEVFGTLDVTYFSNGQVKSLIYASNGKVASYAKSAIATTGVWTIPGTGTPAGLVVTQ